MSDINPTELYRRYQRKELDKAAVIGYLKSFIESSSDEDLRVRSVELLGEMNLEAGEVFEFFEHLVTSDESNHVRLESLKNIVRDFFDKGIESIRYVINHENSADNLYKLYKEVETVESK